MKGVSAIILAAGQGKRMKSALPKVAHPVLGKPMLWHVARSASAAGIPEIVFVLGNGRDQVMGTVTQYGGKVAVQERQLGTVARIVEERDADASLRRILEVNSGTYAFDRAFLARNLPRLSDVNAQRELYLTDLVLQALEEGRIVVPVVAGYPDEVRGINSRGELADATAILLRATATGGRHRGGSPHRQLRRGEEETAGEGIEGQPPVLHRRYAGGEEGEHRRGDDHLQLRRHRQAHDRHR